MHAKLQISEAQHQNSFPDIFAMDLEFAEALRLSLLEAQMRAAKEKEYGERIMNSS
jgi:hypothetical protein